MVEVCKEMLGNGTLTDEDLRHTPTGRIGGSTFQPDLLSPDKSVAIECYKMNDRALNRLIRYGEYKKHLVLCISIPQTVSEVWCFDINSEKVIAKMNLRKLTKN